MSIIAFVHKHFHEPRQATFDIAEMHPHDFVLRRHFGNGIINAATEQFGHASLAEQHAIAVARRDFKKRASELFQRGTDLGNTAQRFWNRRIVGV